MARRRGRRSSYSNYRKTNYGLDRALQHKREAEALTRELGGTDKDVKDYFFRLLPDELSVVLDEYQKRHGLQARDYAAQTIQKWQTGRVTMSGMVASRLFALLPPRMPLSEKYKLTEGLWRHVGPSSKKTLRIGLDAGVDAVLDAARQHIESVVSEYRIPESLERRFEWLSAGDVSVKQALLNHVRHLEKNLVVDGARAQVPMMLEHMRSDAALHTHRMAQILRVGKHELELLIDKNALGVAFEETRPTSTVPSSSAKGEDWTWLWWVLGILAAVIFFASRR